VAQAFCWISMDWARVDCRMQNCPTMGTTERVQLELPNVETTPFRAQVRRGCMAFTQIAILTAPSQAPL
jgi:hypothetical protein